MKPEEVKYPTSPNDLVHSFASTFEDSGNGGGLTKREYFAALMMSGHADRQGDDYATMAAYAVIAADELIKALNKESK